MYSPPATVSPGVGSLREICASSGLYDDAGGSTRRPCNRALVPLPKDQSQPMCTSEMLSDGDRDWLCDYIANLLRDEQKTKILHQEVGPREPYLDPVLKRNPATYADVPLTLAGRGMLEWTVVPQSFSFPGRFFRGT